jgi:heme-degrading monooxygenase HmoA
VITTFEVMPGVCHDVLDLLRDAYAAYITHQPGFIGAALHVNDAQTRIASYSQWRQREDFLAMLRSAEMRERNRRISALCKSFEPVMYEVAETFG